MTFTPKGFAIGDYVTIVQPESNEDGTFAAGTEFEVIDVYVRHGRTYLDLRDHEQNLLLEVPPEDVRHSRIAGE